MENLEKLIYSKFRLAGVFLYASVNFLFKIFFNSISQNTQNILQYFWIFREVIYQLVLQ